MIRGTNQDVVESWIQGEPMQHMSGKLSTDGNLLKSYNLVIGMTDENREKVVGNYTADGGDFYSQTTSKHVGRAIRTLENVWEIHKNQNSEFRFRVVAPSEMLHENLHQLNCTLAICSKCYDLNKENNDG